MGPGFRPGPCLAATKGLDVKVRMKVGVTGTRNGDRWPDVGGELVVGDDEGASLCAQGLAEPVAEPAPAKAEKRAPKGKKGDS